MINKNLSSKKGITLVALVVTIVILIILAGVALTLVLGNGGILQRTRDAKTNYTNSSVEEQAQLDSLSDEMDEQLGILPSTAETTPYLPTNCSKVSGTNLSTGLVMQDASGNEYVWVEVPKTAEVYPTAGLSITGFSDDEYTAIEKDLQTYTKTYRTDSSGTETSYTDTYNSDAQTGLTSTQYADTKKAMLSSVYTHGGFWVGRYEAGIDTNRTRHTAVSTPMVTKANQYPYTYVTCSEAETLAKAVAPSGYNSSLLFGVQWDLVLKYLETKKAATQAELKGGDGIGSTNWGNYNNNTYNITSTLGKYSTDYGSNWTNTPYNKTASGDVLLTTGASDTFSKMNIYDIAGNVWEWTMEYTSNSSIPCALRGGSYDSDGLDCPASYRGNSNTTLSYYSIGFRVTLY